jgi:hypothetical protein
MVNVPLPPSSGALDVERAVVATDEPTGPAARTRRGRMWSAAMVATSLVVAWGVVAWRTPARHAASPAPVEATPIPVATPTPTAGPGSDDLAPPSFPGPVLVKDAGRDAAPSAAPAPPPVHHRRAQGPSPAPVEQVQPPGPEPSAVPDDITRNPYR